MYAKLIHPTKIIPANEHLLRAGGRIIVHPTHEDFVKSGYFEVEGLEGPVEDGSYLYTLDGTKILAQKNGGIV